MIIVIEGVSTLDTQLEVQIDKEKHKREYILTKDDQIEEEPKQKKEKLEPLVPSPTMEEDIKEEINVVTQEMTTMKINEPMIMMT